MQRPDLQPNFLSEQECKEIATRQMLSFITLPDSEVEPPPPEFLFTLDSLPDGAIGDGPEILNWKSRDIYDVDGVLLFRDMTLDLGSGKEWRVRTAASDLLRTPVWSVSSHWGGDALKVSTLVEGRGALAERLESNGLEPIFVDREEGVRLVSYNYPNLGILSRSRSELSHSRSDSPAEVVVKLPDLTIIPIEPGRPRENPEALTAVWSPYDRAVRSTFAYFRALWKRNMALLPSLPKSFGEWPDAVRKATETARPTQHFVEPLLTLIPQIDPDFCAAATAQMILQQHGIAEIPPQDVIADRMQAEADGATPEIQVAVLNEILAGTGFEAVGDDRPTFEKAQDELLKDLPFRTSGPAHARAVAGFRAEAGDKNWLYIFDPEPENLGAAFCEDWTADARDNFMYVRPVQPHG